MPETPSIEDIIEARDAIAGIAVRTPLVLSALSGCTPDDVLLKLETLQPVGSFKLRGAAFAISRLDDAQKRAGVVCFSTGNHGRAVAYAARAQGIRATICLPSLASPVKRAAIEALAADIRVPGATQDEAEREVERLVREEGMTDIPPFDHPDVIAGQGTIALELLEDRPDLETIVVPLSGGGLLCGIAIAAKALKPSIRIVGVTMARGAAMVASLEAGKPVDVPELPTLCDALVGGIGLGNRYTLRLCQEYMDEVITLSEQEIYRGMTSLLFDERLIAEPSSALGHAAMIAGRLKPTGPTALIISGKNVDMQLIRRVINAEPITLGDETVAPD